MSSVTPVERRFVGDQNAIVGDAEGACADRDNFDRPIGVARDDQVAVGDSNRHRQTKSIFQGLESA